MYVDPALATSSIALDVSSDDAQWLKTEAAGRPLVVDYRASPLRGIAVGDLTVGFASGQLEPRYVEIEPIGDVRVLVERHLIGLLASGAGLCRHSRPWGQVLSLSLVQPERWVDFLESHPGRHP
jgi:hypothetical protein